MNKITTKSRAWTIAITVLFGAIILRALFPDFFTGIGDGFTDGLR